MTPPHACVVRVVPRQRRVTYSAFADFTDSECGTPLSRVRCSDAATGLTVPGMGPVTGSGDASFRDRRDRTGGNDGGVDDFLGSRDLFDDGGDAPLERPALFTSGEGHTAPAKWSPTVSATHNVPTGSRRRDCWRR